jgi:hypothetical protein
LATQISTEQQKVETTLRAGLEHARKAGELLNKAKASLPHGQWLRWLKENCTNVAERTAQTYMAVSNRWDELQTKSATPVADLPFRAAIKLLSKGDKQPDDPALAPFHAALANFRQFCQDTDEADFDKAMIAETACGLWQLAIDEGRKVCIDEGLKACPVVDVVDGAAATIQLLLHRIRVGTAVVDGLDEASALADRIIEGILNRADNAFLRYPEALRTKLAGLGFTTGSSLLLAFAGWPVTWGRRGDGHAKNGEKLERERKAATAATYLPPAVKAAEPLAGYGAHTGPSWRPATKDLKATRTCITSSASVDGF